MENKATVDGKLDNLDYYVSNEFEDVRASLLLLVQSLETVKREPAFWKWAVLSAHSALQSSCVCILTENDSTGAYKNKSSQALKTHISQINQPKVGKKEGMLQVLATDLPALHVMSLVELLKNLPEILRVIIPKKVTFNESEQIHGLYFLHTLRNDYTHFTANTVSVDTKSLLDGIGAALTLVEQIVVSTSYHRYNKFSDMNIQPDIDKAKVLLQELQNLTNSP